MPHDRKLFDHSPGSGWTIDGELDEYIVLDIEGRPAAYARVPRIARRFTSSMHTVESITRTRAPWGNQFIAFMCGRIPFARLRPHIDEPSDLNELRSSVLYALEQGAAGLLRLDTDGRPEGALALSDRISDSIDLDALYADYADWLAAAGITPELGRPADEIRRELDAGIRELRSSRYSDYLDCYRDLRVPDQFPSLQIVDGIVLGEEPAITCAYMLHLLTGDRRLWRRPS